MRLGLVLITLLSAAGAAAEELPVPPPVPQQPLTEGAPIPDPDMRSPTSQGSSQANLNVRFYRARNYDPSAGFTPGSRYQSSEDRKPIQTPGLSVSVPIQ